MKSYKDIFNEKHAELTDEGYSDEEADKMAGEYAQDYIEQRADHIYDMMKEKRRGGLV